MRTLNKYLAALHRRKRLTFTKVRHLMIFISVLFFLSFSYFNPYIFFQIRNNQVECAIENIKLLLWRIDGQILKRVYESIHLAKTLKLHKLTFSVTNIESIGQKNVVDDFGKRWVIENFTFQRRPRE